MTPHLFGALAPTPNTGLALVLALRFAPTRDAAAAGLGRRFSWTGVTGTYFWIDPQQELIAILMMQAPIERLHYRYLMRTLVYQSIAE